MHGEWQGQLMGTLPEVSMLDLMTDKPRQAFLTPVTRRVGGWGRAQFALPVLLYRLPHRTRYPQEDRDTGRRQVL